MRPISYTTKDNITTYHYSFTTLRDFLKRGKLTGDVGMILVSRDEVQGYIRYKGFGTIENPHKWICGITMKHMPLFDGELSSNEDIIHPKLVKNNDINYDFFFIDMNTGKKITFNNK